MWPKGAPSPATLTVPRQHQGAPLDSFPSPPKPPDRAGPRGTARGARGHCDRTSVARVLPERAPVDLNRAGWRAWAVLLAALVLLAAALLLVGRLIEPF